MDNGKDFRRVAKGAMPAYLRESDVAPTSGMSASSQELKGSRVCWHGWRIAARTALCVIRKSKHVERFFGTMHRAAS